MNGNVLSGREIETDKVLVEITNHAINRTTERGVDLLQIINWLKNKKRIPVFMNKKGYEIIIRDKIKLLGSFDGLFFTIRTIVKVNKRNDFKILKKPYSIISVLNINYDTRFLGKTLVYDPINSGKRSYSRVG